MIDLVSIEPHFAIEAGHSLKQDNVAIVFYGRRSALRGRSGRIRSVLEIQIAQFVGPDRHLRPSFRLFWEPRDGPTREFSFRRWVWL